MAGHSINLYSAKRFCLMAVCALNILLAIVFISLVKLTTDQMIDHLPADTTEDEKKTFKIVSIIILVIVAVLQILFQFVGLFSAWREHLVLALTFTVLQILVTAGCLTNAIRSHLWYYYLDTLWQVAVAIAAGLYLLDLRKLIKRRHAANEQARAAYNS